jgi:hypothetical protein
LHRAKKLFLQKKEAEERRLLLEREREERRRREEEESRRCASIKEAERIEGERRERRSEVGRCLSDVLIAGVERRMGYESGHPGAHYAAHEAMGCIVASIEKADAEERAMTKARKREEGARRKMEKIARLGEEEERRRRRREAWACLCDVVDAVEAGATTMTTLTPPPWSLSHHGDHRRPPHTTTMPPPHAAAMQIVHPTMTNFGGYHHNYAMTIVPSSPFYAPPNGAHVGTMARPVVDPHGVFSTYELAFAADAAAGHRMAHPTAINPHYAFHSQPPAAIHRMPAVSSYGAIVGQGSSSSTVVHPAARPHPPPPPPPPPPSSMKAPTPAPPALLHPRPVTDPHSPYAKTHVSLPGEIRLTKGGGPGERFGVTLRFECRSALVPREDDERRHDAGAGSSDAVGAAPPGDAGGAPSAGPVPSSTRKPRRRRVNYGVVSVVDASAAAYCDDAAADAVLRPGDIILSINGASVGLTFADACRAMADSPSCTVADVVRCTLTVARPVVAGPVVAVRGTPTSVRPPPGPPAEGGLAAAAAAAGPTAIAPAAAPPAAPAPAMIPFRAGEDGTVHGEFSHSEWTALVRGLSTMPHRLFSGMALIPVSEREALVAIRGSDEHGGSLQRRGLESLEAKLAHELKRVSLDMRRRAERHWSTEWKAETERDADRGDEGGDSPPPPLTDAQRSALRSAARPARGCKCGSPSHDYVSDPRCPLYGDVRRYCGENSVDIRGANRVGVDATRKAPTATTRAKNVVEKAYIDRFVKLRAENSATREEAEFVLKMETIQASMMKKGVLAPPSLCTLILSAVASVMEKLEGVESTCEVGRNKDPISTTKKRPLLETDSDDSADSDDDGLPLNSLIQSGSKRTASNANSPPSKRLKQTESSESKSIEKMAPHPYCLAEILKHVSLCHGHLFEGKTVRECMTSGTCPWEIMFPYSSHLRCLSLTIQHFRADSC